MSRHIHWPQGEARWIWIPQPRPRVNQYVEFRRVFRLRRQSPQCLAHISVDSDYELWVNGVRAGANQFPNWPRRKTFNTHDVTHLLKSGVNCLAVRVYYRGESFSTYAKGKPGLICALTSPEKPLLHSDALWRCRLSPSYHSGRLPKVSPQLGFTIHYDARGEDGWQRQAYQENPRQWKCALELAGTTDGYWRSLEPRPLPPMLVSDPKPAALIAAGYLLRRREHKRVAQTMSEDALITAPLTEQLDDKGIITDARILKLPAADQRPLVIQRSPRGHGIYLVFDLGCEEAGLLDLDVDAPAGTILDIAHGEHLDDLRVRMCIGARNFADRYVCRPGRQQWLQPYRRLGCRYLQIHIPRCTGPIKVYHATLRPVHYPFKFRGAFSTSDHKLNDIWHTSRRTLDLCVHEHYEDCPWREQGMYTCDSRLQALYGYYAFGETALPGYCWSLFGGGMRHDGLLDFPAPGKLHVSIPGFSLHWISALWEHALYSGEDRVIREQYDNMCVILDTALQRMTPQGVVPNSEHADHWHFYEWTDGLEGVHPCDGTGPIPKSTDAIYNLLLINALRSAARSGRCIGDDRANDYGQAAQRVARAFHGVFWNEKRQAYASFRRRGRLSHYAQLTQALAITEGVTRNHRQRNRLCRMLAEDANLVSAEYPSKLVLYEALLGQGEKYAPHVLDETRTVFGGMLAAGATSLWETAGGAEAFSRAGSLCHAWSAVLTYLAGAHLLGVKPLEMGFKEFSVKPLTGGLHAAQGTVPTPSGPIKIAWEQCRNVFRLRLRHPRSLTPVLSLPKGKRIEMI